MLTINEGSRQRFQFVFEDETRQKFIPSTARYRLDDITEDCKQEVIGWTDIDMSVVTLEQPAQILIPSTANAILHNGRRFETRVLSVQSDYGTDDQLSDDESYKVKNLRGFTSS